MFSNFFISLKTKLSPKLLRVFVLGMVVCLTIALLYWFTQTNNQLLQNNQNLASKDSQIASLSAQIKNTIKENEILKNEESKVQLTFIENTLDKYLLVKDKSASYKASGVDTAAVDAQFPTVADLLLAQKYSEADTLLSKLDTDLETALKSKQAAAAAAAKPKTTSSSSNCSSLPSSGYCKMSINGYTVYVVAGSISSVRTVTANSDNCNDNCPTKSLQNYISDNGGFAGMNGTYFCPPDYSTCAGKVNSFDFPVYNSNLGKWINEDKMLWTNRAMIAFTSGSAHFYPNANSYSGLSGIKAGIVNFPGLVYNGQNIVNNYSLTSAQNTKGTRGGIGVKGSIVYLVIASSATVGDFAGIMTSLGMTHALNLDGGGSTALYSGGYKVGPGRALPNAVILK